jgi:hypothetical protein
MLTPRGKVNGVKSLFIFFYLAFLSKKQFYLY